MRALVCWRQHAWFVHGLCLPCAHATTEWSKFGLSALRLAKFGAVLSPNRDFDLKICQIGQVSIFQGGNWHPQRSRARRADIPTETVLDPSGPCGQAILRLPCVLATFCVFLNITRVQTGQRTNTRGRGVPVAGGWRWRWGRWGAGGGAFRERPHRRGFWWMVRCTDCIFTHLCF